MFAFAFILYNKKSIKRFIAQCFIECGIILRCYVESCLYYKPYCGVCYYLIEELFRVYKSYFSSLLFSKDFISVVRRRLIYHFTRK